MRSCSLFFLFAVGSFATVSAHRTASTPGAFDAAWMSTLASVPLAARLPTITPYATFATGTSAA